MGLPDDEDQPVRSRRLEDGGLGGKVRPHRDPGHRCGLVAEARDQTVHHGTLVGEGEVRRVRRPAVTDGIRCDDMEGRRQPLGERGDRVGVAHQPVNQHQRRELRCSELLVVNGVIVDGQVRHARSLRLREGGGHSTPKLRNHVGFEPRILGLPSKVQG